MGLELQSPSIKGSFVRFLAVNVIIKLWIMKISVEKLVSTDFILNESYTVAFSHDVINNLHILDFPPRNVPQRVNNEIGKFPV